MGAAAKDDKARSASPEASSKPVVDDAVTKSPVVDGDDKAEAEKADAPEEAAETAEPTEAAEEKTDAAPEAEEATPSKPAKTPVSIARRKSVGPKLNRKGSKARITHLDAQPGDHYFVKLKGYPAWPVVICDEDMLPQTLLKGRPVTAARPDGTYREDYADGGKRAADRTFPVMYLSTNEFGWVPNQDLHDLDPSKVIDSINDKMRKDLQEAHRIAAESNPLDYYKDLLRQFQEELELEEERQREAAAKRLATPKKAAKKSKSEDVDMMDVPEDDDEPVSQKKSVSKKRKAEDDARTPQRSDSVKKPKIKITSSGTPKSNGTPSSTKVKADGKTKTKAKTESKAKEPVNVPAEPEPTPEEKVRRKAKEVLFLRHKIQKGLLPRDEEPKADEMESVSDFLTKLEGFPDLEVSVIRETKINKVLKAVLKIATIPREDEFKFKPRSQTLLDKWNKLLAAEPAPAAATTNGSAKEGANGTKEEPKKEAQPKEAEPKEAKSNGVKEDAKPAEKAEEAAAVEAEA